MNPFKKSEMAPVPAAVTKRSRIQSIMDDLTISHRHAESAVGKFMNLAEDLDKGVAFLERFKKDLLEFMMEHGVSVKADPEIEEQIAEFIPKRRANAEAQKVEERSKDSLSGSAQRD